MPPQLAHAQTSALLSLQMCLMLFFLFALVRIYVLPPICRICKVFIWGHMPVMCHNF